MPRRAALAALLLLLPALATPVESGHVDSYWFFKRLFEAPNWTLSEKGEYRASSTATHSGGGSLHYEGTIDTEWSATGRLRYDPATSVFEGKDWAMTWRATGRTVERLVAPGGGSDTLTCTLDVSGQGQLSVRGLWSLGRARDIQLLGQDLDATMALRIIPLAEVGVIRPEHWSCSIVHAHDPFDHPHRTLGPAFSVFPHGLWGMHRYLAGEIPRYDALGLGYWNGTGPWPAPRGSEESLRHVNHVGSSPYVTLEGWTFRDPDSAVSRQVWGPLFYAQQNQEAEDFSIKTRTCDQTQMIFEHPEQCTWISRISFQGAQHVCAALEEALREDFEILQEMLDQFPQEADEGRLLRYHSGLIAPQLVSILGGMKQAQIFSCPHGSDHGRYIAALDAYNRRMLSELRRLHEGGTLGKEGVDFARGLHEHRMLWGAVQGGGGPGSVTVRVASPVSLHAFTPDGRHVGWNASAQAPEIGIPNATYEGRPGSAQTIRLPPGFYRFEVVEQGPGNFTLRVEWDLPGRAGNDTVRLPAAPGNVTRARWLAGYDAAGNATAVPGLFYRGPPQGEPRLAALDASWLDRPAGNQDGGSNRPGGADGSGTGSGIGNGSGGGSGGGNGIGNGTGNGTGAGDGGSPGPRSNASGPAPGKVAIPGVGPGVAILLLALVARGGRLVRGRP